MTENSYVFSHIFLVKSLSNVVDAHMHQCLFSFATVAHAKLYMTSLYVNISTSVLSYPFADHS